jgi:hypothetical protein
MWNYVIGQLADICDAFWNTVSSEGAERNDLQNQAFAQGYGNGLTAIGYIHFAENMADMCFGCGSANKESLGYFAIVKSFHKQGQYLHFPVGQGKIPLGF